MKKRVCSVVPNVAGGGVESVLQNYFAHMNVSDMELDLITYGVDSSVCARKFIEQGFHIIEIPPKRKGFLMSLRAMYDVLRKGNYDIVHAHLADWNCIPVCLAFLCGVKHRISHSHIAVEPVNLKGKLLLFVQKALNRCFATCYCACGDDAAKHLYGERLVAKGKVKVLHNAIEAERFLPDARVRAEVRKELGIAEGTFCVGHIGRFMAQKNHTFLIDIFDKIVEKRPDSCLVLLGMGELEAEIKGKVSKLGLSERVKFLGVRSDANRIYQAMDVFCLPSLFEGLPVVGVEAQAAQLPCVISDTVSDKVRMTKNAHMVSLNKTAAEWADIVLTSERVQDTLPAQYLIDQAAREWEKLYSL